MTLEDIAKELRENAIADKFDPQDALKQFLATGQKAISEKHVRDFEYDGIPIRVQFTHDIV